MDVMIDLETLGTEADAVILSIGLAAFDLDKGVVTNTAYLELPVQEQIDDRRSITASTLSWWMGQYGSARKVLDSSLNSPVLVYPVLKAFEAFFAEVFDTHESDDIRSKLTVWGNGPTFDMVILANLLNQYNIKIPWHFSKVMDLRTFRRFVGKGERIENKGTKHNALDDSIAQAEYVIKHTRVGL